MKRPHRLIMCIITVGQTLSFGTPFWDNFLGQLFGTTFWDNFWDDVVYGKQPKRFVRYCG